MHLLGMCEWVKILVCTGVDSLATQFADALRASVGDDDKLVPLDHASFDNTSGLMAPTCMWRLFQSDFLNVSQLVLFIQIGAG
eukprot:6469386-Amphidinium_carterae.2